MTEFKLREDETIDALNHGLRIIQRRKGHRAASDDVLLAAFALERLAPGARILELGCGKATVGLMILATNPDARIVGVEAFEASYDLALRNRALNGLEERLTLMHADLRHLHMSESPPFDLVIGAPPFMPVGSGTFPRDPQRQAARFELRGGVEAYFACAARHLSPEGLALILMDGQGASRAIGAAEAEGLRVSLVVEVSPRPGRPPTYVLVHAGLQGRKRELRTLEMRPEKGDSWTPAYTELRALLGFE